MHAQQKCLTLGIKYDLLNEQTNSWEKKAILNTNNFMTGFMIMNLAREFFTCTAQHSLYFYRFKIGHDWSTTQRDG